MPARMLLVDDDPITLRLLAGMMQSFGYLSESVSGGQAALDRINDTSSAPIDVVILDLVMPDVDGMMVLDELKKMPAPPAVIVQTAQGGIDTAISAMRAGAFDFLVKPAAPERLRVSITNALKLSALQGEVQRLRHRREETVSFDDMIASAPAMMRTMELGQRAARSAISVLIEGEAGTGKEWFAHAIHGESNRRARPFVSVDCGAVPADDIEVLLFGRPATATMPALRGRIHEAQSGTLLLRQIADLPASVQARLAAVLEEGTLPLLAGERVTRADFRLIATTDRRLVDRVAEGVFREDLFYRLNVFPIWLPPLRDRVEDLLPLAAAFLARFAAEEGRPRLKGLAPEAEALLTAFHWPDNIRQLENAVYRAVILCEGEFLRPWDFPQIQTALDAGAIPELVKAWQNEGAAAARTRASSTGHVARAHHRDRETPDRPFASADKISPPLYGLLHLLDRDGEMRALDALEEAAVRFAVEHYGGRMSEVARRLHIGRSTLYRKLKDYGIETAAVDAA
ncbi:sigma-54-dependent transcriptional regulator [Afifella marina]|nr:sigma-54 dependent transcriptional regulator [Afifella marina]